jgi:hypothetical protein
MHRREIQTSALHLSQEIGAPQNALSISSFHERTGDVVLIVHVTPSYRHLCAQIPRIWEGLKVECQVAEMPALSGRAN